MNGPAFFTVVILNGALSQIARGCSCRPRTVVDQHKKCMQEQSICFGSII